MQLGIKSKVTPCNMPGCIQYVKRCWTLSIVIVPISKDKPTTESNFRVFQNLVSEHLVEGVPASLYNLTKSMKSVPDPW